MCPDRPEECPDRLDDDARLRDDVGKAFDPVWGLSDDLLLVLRTIPRFARPLVVIWIAGLMPAAFIIAFDHSFVLAVRYSALAFVALSLAAWALISHRLAPPSRNQPPATARLILNVVLFGLLACVGLVLFLAFR